MASFFTFLVTSFPQFGHFKSTIIETVVLYCSRSRRDGKRADVEVDGDRENQDVELRLLGAGLFSPLLLKCALNIVFQTYICSKFEWS